MDLLPGLGALEGIHPLVVHFPIASVLFALFFEGLYLVTKNDAYRRFSVWMIFIAVLTAIAASITGYMASGAIGHDSPGHDYVHGHRDIMLLLTGILLVIAAILINRKRTKRIIGQYSLFPLLLVASVVLTYGADKGGQLVFEFGVGVAPRIQGENIEHTPHIKSNSDDNQHDDKEENTNHHEEDNHKH